MSALQVLFNKKKHPNVFLKKMFYRKYPRKVLRIEIFLTDVFVKVKLNRYNDTTLNVFRIFVPFFQSVPFMTILADIFLRVKYMRTSKWSLKIFM